MKKRISRVLNFFAFNLLFFALYLNFIHKDNNAQPVPVAKTTMGNTVKGTVLVAHPEQYLNKANKTEVAQTPQLEN
jgi:formate/nitrite transporter FocA (FNT family)